jgi:hypothetical protein
LWQLSAWSIQQVLLQTFEIHSGKNNGAGREKRLDDEALLAAREYTEKLSKATAENRIFNGGGYMGRVTRSSLGLA